MHPVEEHYLDLTRRRFFGMAGRTLSAGIGSIAFASLLAKSSGADSAHPHLGRRCSGTCRNASASSLTEAGKVRY